MARLANKGTYVFLDDAGVWIDYNTGRLHLTSNDRDIPGNGVHLSVRPGTKTEAHLKGLLEKFDVPLTREERDRRRSTNETEAEEIEPQANGFGRLPVEKARASAHHHRTIAWSVMYPWADAEMVAEAINIEKLWTGRERRIVPTADGDYVEALVLYGPVWGGYAADLRRLFKKIGVEITDVEQADTTCERDCTHPSHKLAPGVGGK
jgi:hypothetical protein